MNINFDNIEFNADSSIFCGDDTGLEFNASDFHFNKEGEKTQKRYIKPQFFKLEKKVSYSNAVNIAKDVSLKEGEQQHFIVQGSFIFGDFIEALIKQKNVYCKEMFISSLSLSQNNIDSLAGMMETKRIAKMTMILSNYFYSHEKFRMIPYLLENMDIDNRLELLIMRNHTKICLMSIDNFRIVLSGSSNLRSSNCIEQFVVQESKELYDFYKQWFDDNSKYSIINKEVEK